MLFRSDLKSGSGLKTLVSKSNSTKFLSAIVDGDLSLREIKVFSCLILADKTDDVVRISGNEISQKTQISRGTVTQILKLLINKEFIEKKSGEDNTNCYKLKV